MKWRRMRRARHVKHMRERGGAHSFFVEKSEGRRTLGRTRIRWADNI
jgi:hypothetical protein